jgi:hypothetical protein
MNAALRFALAAFASGGVYLGSLVAADWPAFRGSNGGVSDETNLPVKLSKDNVLWKVKLPGAGTSSPITYGDKVYVSGYSGYGTTISKGMTGGFGGGGFGKGKGKGGKGGGDATGDQKKLVFHLTCFDRQDGKIIWQKNIQPKLPEVSFTGFLREHGYASSTPATDGERIYVFFGKTGVLAFDMEGKQLWQTSVGTSTNQWGSAASPIVHEDLVIVNAAIESNSLVALDKKTGKEVWRVRGVGQSWVSPIVVKTKEGKHEVVLNQVGKIVGYEPKTGKDLWHCQGIGGGDAAGGGGKGGKGGMGGFGGGFGNYTASTPVAKDGVVYVIGGGGPTTPTAIAVKTGGKGDVNKTHVVWRQRKGTTNCSPVLSGDHLCWVSGTATALRISDGKTAYNERLYSNTQEYVSTVAAGDKIYALTRFDGLYVLAGGGKFEQLAHFDFQGDSSIFNASPAISNGRIFIRSNAYLYCIGPARSEP